MKFKEAFKRYNRIFIVPLDHPKGKDTKKLSEKGTQEFVDEIDELDHDGYIFSSYEYTKKPIKTKKDFFLNVGEPNDDYKLDINELKKFKEVKYLSIFFEVINNDDRKMIDFYKDYVSELRENGYIVKGMGYPEETWENPNYQKIVDTAHEIGCDYIKMDIFEGIETLNLHGMRLFIAGAEYKNDADFEEYVKAVASLNTASASLGRNIFESNNPSKRIDLVLQYFNR